MEHKSSKNKKCLETAFENYLSMSTMMNMRLIDFLSDYHPTIFKKSKNILEVRKNANFSTDAKAAYDLAKFMCKSLNDTLSGKLNEEIDVKSPLFKDPYFEKYVNKQEFGIVYFEQRNEVFLTVKSIPKSAIGRILYDYRILTEKKFQEFLNEGKNIDISIEEMPFSLNRKEEVENGDINKIKNNVYKSFKKNNLSQYMTIDNAFIDMGYDEHSYPLLTNVSNNILFSNMLIDLNNINKRRDYKKQEIKIINGLFVKNTLVLDAFRDLTQKGILFNKDMWECALSSLIYGNVPFMLNTKFSHKGGTDNFFKQMYDNLQKLNNSKGEMNVFRGCFENLVSQRLLINDINQSEGIFDVMVFLQKKAKEIVKSDKYKEDNVSSEINAEKAVLKSHAENFLKVYCLELENLNNYSDKNITSVTEVLNFKKNIFNINDMNMKMYLTSKLSVSKMYDDLGFLQNDLLKAAYLQVFKLFVDELYPEVKISSEKIELNNNLTKFIKDFNHANIGDLLKIEHEITQKNHGDILEINFSASPEVMKKEYVEHVVNNVCSLVNAFIMEEVSSRLNKGALFDSIDYRLMNRENGDVYNEALFSIKGTLEFIINKSYKTYESLMSELKQQIRESDLLYFTNDIKSDNVKKVRSKI